MLYTTTILSISHTYATSKIKMALIMLFHYFSVTRTPHHSRFLSPNTSLKTHHGDWCQTGMAQEKFTIFNWYLSISQNEGKEVTPPPTRPFSSWTWVSFAASLLFLHLFWQRNFGDKWKKMKNGLLHIAISGTDFAGKNAVPVTLSKHLEETTRGTSHNQQNFMSAFWNQYNTYFI